MPEPLFTNALHDEVVAAAGRASEADCTDLVAALQKLPQPHYDAVAHLFTHLRKVLAKSDVNKMTADNLATCFGPSVVSTSGNAAADSMMTVGQDNVVVSKLLQYPKVLEEVAAASSFHSIAEAAADGSLSPVVRSPRKTRASLGHVPGENEYVKVIGDAATPIVSFAQFRDLCYELGCNATALDYSDAGGVEGNPMSFDKFTEWMRRSRLAQFVLRSGRKRQGIVQAISYFQFFDKNRDGTVDATEWPALHADLKSHYPWLADDPRECLAQLDANGDGVVELEEYLDWCLKGSPRDSGSTPDSGVEPDPPSSFLAETARNLLQEVSAEPVAGGGSPRGSPKPVPKPRSPKGSPKLSPKPKPRHISPTASPKVSPKPSPRTQRRVAGLSTMNTLLDGVDDLNSV